MKRKPARDPRYLRFRTIETALLKADTELGREPSQYRVYLRRLFNTAMSSLHEIEAELAAKTPSVTVRSYGAGPPHSPGEIAAFNAAAARVPPEDRVDGLLQLGDTPKVGPP